MEIDIVKLKKLLEWIEITPEQMLKEIEYWEQEYRSGRNEFLCCTRSWKRQEYRDIKFREQETELSKPESPFTFTEEEIGNLEGREGDIENINMYASACSACITYNNLFDEVAEAVRSIHD